MKTKKSIKWVFFGAFIPVIIIIIIMGIELLFVTPITVSTNDASELHSTTVTCGGNVQGKIIFVVPGFHHIFYSITSRGVCWSTNPVPTTADNKTVDDYGYGSFISSVTSLSAGTTYYLRAYADYDGFKKGTVYGNTIRITTFAATDANGNNYNAVKIGDQFWLKENLRCTSYSDGTPIPRVQGNNWGTYSAGAYCYYGEDSTTAHIYGYLYNYSAVTHGNLCPPGWHVPSIDEWNTLIAYAGGSSGAGGKLRQKGRMFWSTTESCVTDEYGFSALPGGIRGPGNTSFSIKDKGFWWSATSYNNNYADVCTIASNGCNIINTDPAEKHCGCSIRCVKDN